MTTLPSLPGAARYRFTGTVRAVPLHAPVTVTEQDGTERVGLPGDWLVSDTASTWVCSDVEIRAAYRYTNGVFRHVDELSALRVSSPIMIPTPAGLLAARLGDWVCCPIDDPSLLFLRPAHRFAGTPLA